MRRPIAPIRKATAQSMVTCAGVISWDINRGVAANGALSLISCVQRSNGMIYSVYRMLGMHLACVPPVLFAQVPGLCPDVSSLAVVDTFTNIKIRHCP